MREETGDLFEYNAEAIVIPTNGVVTNKGKAVMSAGVALEAKKRIIPTLDILLGQKLMANGNHVQSLYVRQPTRTVLTTQIVLAFPTKQDWQESASIGLITRSAGELVVLTYLYKLQSVALPRVGCGLGGLNWELQVKPILQEVLKDDRFVVVNKQ